MLNPDYHWKRQDKDYKCETISINNKKSQLQFYGDYPKLRPIEKGEPVFLPSRTEGKTTSLLTLWDSGCGSDLFEDGVPIKELGPAVLRTPGPIFINRVCVTTCKVTGEYTCTLKLKDGNRAILEGCIVDKITSPLFQTNIFAAEAEIEAFQPQQDNG